MAKVLEAGEESALARFTLGLTIRTVMAAVGVPLLVLATQYDHPLGPWLHRLLWVVGPLGGVLMASGAQGFRTHAAGLAFGLATASEIYAAFMGFYDSPLSVEQVPVAEAITELLGLIGMLSMVASIRGSAEDAQAPALVARCHRASANLLVAFVCLLIVRVVMWQGGFAGLSAIIIAGVVVAFVTVALLNVLSVTGGLRSLEEVEG
ncbi:MAG: hypothetical protein KDI37_06955 [Xanthomonadales bacterium]|nr:hypothetical protein [Xanthomonadales bacterium]MCB9549291.1 hypothetical protein [Myxococcales bacterium]